MSQWCHSGHTSIAAMEDVLISALQHYAICPRQCALIHLEQVWVENMHTAQGRILHEFVHSGNMRSRNGVKIITDIDLYSERLGIRGKSDVVELHYNGQKWLPYPVEYKKGRPHGDCYADSLQLCGQALCLEEMFGVYISEGSLFYGTPHKRIKIQFTKDLRKKTEETVNAIRDMLQNKYLPPAERKNICSSCYLIEYCMPRSPTKVLNYLDIICGADE